MTRNTEWFALFRLKAIFYSVWVCRHWNHLCKGRGDISYFLTCWRVLPKSQFGINYHPGVLDNRLTNDRMSIDFHLHSPFFLQFVINFARVNPVSSCQVFTTFIVSVVSTTTSYESFVATIPSRSLANPTIVASFGTGIIISLLYITFHSRGIYVVPPLWRYTDILYPTRPIPENFLWCPTPEISRNTCTLNSGPVRINCVLYIHC